ncbi:MAG: hypothetical protein HON70_31105 [Lentisphaerae bacterium]|nr:hypothetical protein [Lentisphaerota bacterium]
MLRADSVRLQQALANAGQRLAEAQDDLLKQTTAAAELREFRTKYLASVARQEETLTELRTTNADRAQALTRATALQKQNAELHGEAQKLKDRLASHLQERTEAAKASVAERVSLETKLEQALVRSEILTREQVSLQARLRKAEALATKLQKDEKTAGQDHRGSVAELQALIAARDTELRDLRRKLAESIEQRRMAAEERDAQRLLAQRLQKDLQEANSMTAGLGETAAKSRERLAAEIATTNRLEKELAEHRKGLEAEKTATERLQNELTEMRDKLKTTDAAATRLTNELAEKQDELKAKDAAATRLTNELAEKQDELKAKDAAATRLTDELAEKQDELKAKGTATARIENELAERDAGLRRQQETVAAQTRENAQLKKRLADSEQLLQAAQRRLAAAQPSPTMPVPTRTADIAADGLRKKLGAAEARNNALALKLANLDADLTLAKQEAKGAQDKTKRLAAVNEQLIVGLAAQRRRSAEAKVELGAARRNTETEKAKAVRILEECGKLRAQLDLQAQREATAKLGFETVRQDTARRAEDKARAADEALAAARLELQTARQDAARKEEDRIRDAARALSAADLKMTAVQGALTAAKLELTTTRGALTGAEKGLRNQTKIAETERLALLERIQVSEKKGATGQTALTEQQEANQRVVADLALSRKELQRQHVVLAGERKRWTTKHAEQLTKIGELQRQLNDAAERLKAPGKRAHGTESTAGLQALNTRIEDAEQKRLAAESKVEEGQRAAAIQDKTLAALQRRVQDLSALAPEIEKKEQEATDANARIGELNQALEKARDAVRNGREESAGRARECQRLNAMLDTLQKKAHTLEEQLGMFRRKAGKRESEDSRLAAQLELQTAQIRTLDSQRKQLGAKAAEQTELLRRRETTIAKLEKQNTDLTTELNAHRENLSKQTGHIAGLTAKTEVVDGLTASLSDVDAQLLATQKKVAALTDLRDAGEARIRELTRHLEEKRDDIRRYQQALEEERAKTGQGADQLLEQVKKLTKQLAGENERRRALETVLARRDLEEPVKPVQTVSVEAEREGRSRDVKFLVRGYLRQGLAAEDKGNVEAAVWNYKKVLDYADDHRVALHRLGLISAENGDDDAAERLLHQAFRADPDNMDILVPLGFTLVRQGQPDLALSMLTRAVALYPERHDAHRYLGIACSSLGWVEAAEVQFRRALKLKRDDNETAFNLAVLLASVSPPRMTEAKKWYKHALASGSPHDPGLDAVFEITP